jgi:hypothetical protein
MTFPMKLFLVNLPWVEHGGRPARQMSWLVAAKCGRIFQSLHRQAHGTTRVLTTETQGAAPLTQPSCVMV